ncbi:MAG TPA: hypothetical protein VES67_03995, partial [Vicinamibacterales bacterium]|nr:hypothetical protein [Vicinamibacterales bacterium]
MQFAVWYPTVFAAAVSLIMLTSNPYDAPASQGPTIAVNSSQRFQTMHGWEAALLASTSDWTGLTDAQIGAGLDLAINDLGISRVRLAIRSGTEGSGGTSYNIVNDNSDPNVINQAGFNFGVLDTMISRVVVPARQRSQARGESLYVNLNYVDFGTSTFEHYANPQEYAEFMLATFQHIQGKYGFVPNGIEVILEPDNVAGWSGDAIGRAMVATAAKLQANGFAVPEFIAPSTTAMPNADGYLDGILAVAGA